MRLKGTPVSPGISVGRARLVRTQRLSVTRYSVPEDRLDDEVERLQRALDAAAEELLQLKERVQSKLHEEFLSLFDAYVVILRDPALIKTARGHIVTQRMNAEYAVQKSIEGMVRALQSSQDPYFRERALDLEDLNRRVQIHLNGKHKPFPSLEGDNLIILADNLSPSETEMLHVSSVTAFATEHGARTSHTAILARSLEIPAVVGVSGLMQASSHERSIIVDGLDGTVIIDPTKDELEEYEQKAEAYERYRKRIQTEGRLEARTVDGRLLKVSANIDLEDELSSAISAGAEGVGLYRSEFLFLKHSPQIPTEEQHFEVYRKICEQMYPHRVVIRTLDLGGEKYFQNVLEPEEKNPVLGVRAIRFCLRHPEIFRPQLRGLLRAAVGTNLAILFPLVTTVDELQQALQHLEDAKQELKKNGIPFNPDVPVGIMVEVPATALTAEAFAPHIQFFSIGTNDLIQYLMACDRNNENVAALYDPMHPAVLSCLSHVCDVAHKNKLKITVCGEVGSDPVMTPLLLGMGVDELSMTPASILEVKAAIRELSYQKCRKIARKALKAKSSVDASRIVRNALNLGMKKGGA